MIRDEDHKAFQEAMKGVKPLDPQGQPERKAAKIKKPFKMKVKNLEPEKKPKTTHYFVHPKEDPYGASSWVSGEDELVFARGGIQQKTLQQLARGQLTIDKKLDLHGLIVEEALDLLQTTLENCQQLHKRVLLLIHGKGHYSLESAPVLKNVLNQWLRESPLVLAFRSAIPKHGGRGALYILIRTKRQK